MNNIIKFGICEWALPIPGIQNFRILSEIGINGIVLEFGDYEHGFPLSNPRIQREYVQAAEDYGIEFPTLGVNDFCERGLTNLEGTETRRIVKDTIVKAIDAAANMKIPKVYFPSFFASLIRNEKDWEMTVDCYHKACDYASKAGIVICSENALSAEDNLKLITLVGRENFRIYFDTQNPYYYNGTYAPDMIRTLKDYIAEVHVKDGTREIISGSMLGEGETSFYKSIDALKEIGYSGWIVSENYYDRLPLRLLSNDCFELLEKDLQLLKSLF